MSGNAKFSWFFLLPSSINMMTNKKYLGLLILAVLPNFGCVDIMTMYALNDGKLKGYVHPQKTARDIIINLGYAYEKLGRIDEAIKEYRAALKIAPEAKYRDSNLYDQVWSGMLREKEGD